MNKKVALSIIVGVALAIVAFLAFRGNPPQSQQASSAPIINEPTSTPMMTVELFYYNKAKDANATCSPDTVQYVARNIPVTSTPLTDTVTLLLEGKLTDAEKSAGFQTEFPLDGFGLKYITAADGTFTLHFTDPNNKTSGGSCRVSLLRTEIEKTAMQFPTVKVMKFTPETLFQP